MAPRKRSRGARSLRRQLPMQLALMFLWIALWGAFDWSTIGMAVIVSIAIPAIFYLPPIESTGRFNPFWTAWFVLHLLYDITRSSLLVAAQAMGIAYSPQQAIIGVKMRTRSDLILTATAEASTLVPGTMALDADREHGELFLHLFSVRNEEQIEKARTTLLETEARLIMAFGSKRDVAKLRKERERRKAQAGGKK